MAAGHGGARPGSGPKPGAKAATQAAEGSVLFADPLSYLIAVATGATPGDGLRVAAAKAALPWTLPKQRAPVESPPPRELKRRAAAAGEADTRDEWLRKAKAVRAKHKRPDDES